MKRFNRTFTLALMSWWVMAGNALALITMDTVSVRNAGNANDTTGFGAVAYDYSIGKYEVTIDQYCSFLNAVAATDTYSLYNVNMAGNVNVAGILRSGVPGSYTYSVIGDGQRPITYVSWFDAARFVNWLNNWQPVGGQNAGTTEQGAYALNGAMSGFFTRSANMSWGLPTENEWYKAAYYQPATQGGDLDNYWLYPTASNTRPDSRPPNSTFPNSANYFYNDSLANGYNGGYAVNNSTALPTGIAITGVGAYTLADSYFLTYDQAGNVAEWTDGIFGASRVVRGGSWGDGNITATSRAANPPSSENQTYGFRILLIPEPSAIGLMALALGILGWKRKDLL